MDYCEALPVTAADITKETPRDQILRRVYQYTKCGWGPNGEPVIEQYRRRASELSIENGCLLWAIRVIIPSKLRLLILSELHKGHLGMSRMKSLARSYVWWPSLDKEIEEVVKQCEACQSWRSKPARIDPPHPWIYPQKPWERVYADFCEVVGKQYLLMVESFSKWPEVHDLGTHTSTSTSSGSSQNNNSARENITQTTPMSQQSHQIPPSATVTEERPYPLRENRNHLHSTDNPKGRGV